MGMQQGSTTSTRSETPFNAAQYLDYQNKAVNLSNANPINYYPDQTYAPPSDYTNYLLGQSSGFGGNAGDLTQGAAANSQLAGINSNTAMSQGTGDYFDILRNIGGPNNPLNFYAGGGAMAGAQPYMQGLTDVTRGPAAQQLQATAGGAYLGSNPYLDAVYKHAADPMTERYMAATAPATDNTFSAAGRFNSGANANARTVNQNNLGDALGGMGAQLFGTDYANERNRQVQAASSLGTMDINALNAALQGYNTQSAIGEKGASDLGTQGNIAANTALGAMGAANLRVPTLSGLATSDYATGLQAQAQLQQQRQAQINDLIQRFYGVQSSPWETLKAEAGIVGSPTPGVTTQSTPYFYNPIQQALGTALTVAKLGATLAG